MTFWSNARTCSEWFPQANVVFHWVAEPSRRESERKEVVLLFCYQHKETVCDYLPETV